MAKKGGSNKVNEIEAAIEFLRLVKEKAPKGNEIIETILRDNENILLEQHFKLTRRTNVSADGVSVHNETRRK